MKYCWFSFLVLLVLAVGCQTQKQSAEKPILSSTLQSPAFLEKKIIERLRVRIAKKV